MEDASSSESTIGASSVNMEELAKTHEEYKECCNAISSIAKELKKLYSQSVLSDSEEIKQQMSLISDAQSKMMEDFSRILVVGESSSGKSSFINSLLGACLVASSYGKTTAHIWEIEHGPFKLFQETPKGERTAIDVSAIDLSKGYPAALKKLTSSVPPTNLMRLCWPSPILKSGIVIVDTPGLNDTVSHDEEVKNYATKAIGVIVLINAAHGMTVTIETFIKGVMEKTKLDSSSFFFIHTFLDKCDEEETQANVSKLEEDMQSRLGITLNSSNYIAANLKRIIKDIEKAKKGDDDDASAERDKLIRKLLLFFETSFSRKLYQQGFVPIQTALQFLERSTKKLKRNLILGKDDIEARIDAHATIASVYTMAREEALEDARGKLEDLGNQLESYARSLKPSLEMQANSAIQSLSSKQQPRAADPTFYHLFMMQELHRQAKELLVAEAKARFEAFLEELFKGQIKVFSELLEQVEGAEEDEDEEAEEEKQVDADQSIQPFSFQIQRAAPSFNSFMQSRMAATPAGYAAGVALAGYAAPLGILAPVVGTMANVFMFFISGKNQAFGWGFETMNDWRNVSDIFDKPEEYSKAMAAHFFNQDVIEKGATQLAHDLELRLMETIEEVFQQLDNRFDHANTIVQQLKKKIEGNSKDKKCEEDLEALSRLKQDLFSCSWWLLCPFFIKPRDLKVDMMTYAFSTGMFKGELLIGQERKQVGVKIYPSRLGIEPIFLECEALRNLNHENVIQFYGLSHDESQNCIYVITEWMDDSLMGYLKQNPSADIKSLLLDVAKGIQHIHDKGYLHRDINPDSLLVKKTPNGVVVKLAELGSAKQASAAFTTQIGTEGYQAPEILEGKPQTPAIDIYAFGMVIWQVFHPDDSFASKLRDFLGKEKGGMSSKEAILRGIMPPVDKKVPNDLKELMLACLQVDPQKRPSIMEIFLRLTIHTDYKVIPALMQKDPPKKLRVLCLDGGGSRGIIMARFLYHLEQKTGKKIHEMFDLICGTSTGGILALALSMLKFSGEECVNLYLQMAGEVFSKKWLSNLLKDAPLYDATNLEGILTRYFAQKRLTPSETDTKVFVVTKRDGAPGAYLLRNYEHERGKPLHAGATGWFAREAARATSAAPFYFAPLKLSGHNFVDGGLGYNNPSQLALDEVLGLTGLLLSDSVKVVVSLGCGVAPSVCNNSRGFSINPLDVLRNHFTSTLENLKFLVDQATDSLVTDKVVAHHCKMDQIPYLRYSPSLPTRMDLDISKKADLVGLMDLVDEDVKNSPPANLEGICKML